MHSDYKQSWMVLGFRHSSRHVFPVLNSGAFSSFLGVIKLKFPFEHISVDHLHTSIISTSIRSFYGRHPQERTRDVCSLWQAAKMTDNSTDNNERPMLNIDSDIRKHVLASHDVEGRRKEASRKMCRRRKAANVDTVYSSFLSSTAFSSFDSSSGWSS